MKYLEGFEGLILEEESWRLFTMYVLSCEETGTDRSEEAFAKILDLFASSRLINLNLERALNGKALLVVEDDGFFECPATSSSQEARFEAMWKIVSDPDSEDPDETVYLA